MPTQVRLFISAGPDEEPVRESLGRALAELPVNIGWVIKRTPDVDSVPECHLFIVILGQDIVAPVGLELWWAMRTEKPVIGYLLQGYRTPAGQVFAQENRVINWTRFDHTASLRRSFLRDVARFLLTHPDRYGVTATEAETFRGMIALLDSSPAHPPGRSQDEDPKWRGAGGGGVILAPGKDVPRGAQVIGED